MNAQRSFISLFTILCGCLWLAPAGATPASIAPGGKFTCGIDQVGVTRCWGYGGNGALGDGNTLSRSAPVEVSGDFVTVEAGYGHVCGLTAAGGVRCWGENASGQLGDGTTVDSPVPRNVSGLASGVQAISAGDAHSCALLVDGTVRCWGEADYGRLGDGSTSDQTTPHEVLALDAPVLAIAAGGRHTCALMSDHGMKCWGYNQYGQLGDGSQDTRTTPVDVSIGNDITALATGEFHTCALDDSGGVWCWGRNSNGQTGHGTDTYAETLPLAVYDLGAGSGVQSITAGADHSCAMINGSNLLCWGYNYYGQLGKGDQTDSLIPAPVSAIGGTVVAIQAGSYHTCALDTDARPYCWGDNNSGEVGYDGFSYRVLAPVRVSGLDTPAVQVSLLNATGCAVTLLGGAMCWGDNEYGQIGDGSQDSNGYSIDHYGARDVFGLTEDVRKVAAGGRHMCALKQDGTVWCWGDNTYGQVGDGDDTVLTRITPVQVTSLANVVAVDAGWYHSCALTAAGAMYCWGRNENGEIGDGSIDDRHTPVAVTGLGSAVAAISIGQYYSCALLDNGGVRCWGDNYFGQLGDGTRIDRHVPTSIDDADNYAQIAAGGDHSCGLTTSGAAKCWGYNGYGQVGDGSDDNYVESPIPVDGLESATTLIATGSSHSCAVQGGTLKCWGANNNYQLGDGGHANQPLPEPITAISGTITGVTLGNDSSCVLMSSGNTLCFGYDYGTLGNGSAANHQIVPAEVARWNWREDHLFFDGFEL